MVELQGSEETDAADWEASSIFYTMAKHLARTWKADQGSRLQLQGRVSQPWDSELYVTHLLQGLALLLVQQMLAIVIVTIIIHF